MFPNEDQVQFVYRIAKKRFDSEDRTKMGAIDRTGGRAILEAMFNLGMVNEDWGLCYMEPSEGMRRFFKVYAEAVTDPYGVRNELGIDLEEGEDPMERAAQEFCKMALRGMWEELAENLANATIYAN